MASHPSLTKNVCVLVSCHNDVYFVLCIPISSCILYYRNIKENVYEEVNTSHQPEGLHMGTGSSDTLCPFNSHACVAAPLLRFRERTNVCS